MRGKPAWKRLSPPDLPNYILARMEKCLESGRWEYGKRAATLERKIGRELGVPADWVVVTLSASAALEACARFILEGTVPIRVSPLTWPATYNAILNHGSSSSITWVDCNEEGWPVEAVDVAVDLWGRPYRFPQDPLVFIFDVQAKFPLVIDAAHNLLDPGHGILLREGSGIKAVVYSFNVQKEASCICGGALVSPEVTQLPIREWLNYGVADRLPLEYNGEFLGGIKGTMPDPLAVWVLEQIKRLPRTRRKRKGILKQYERHLGKLLVTTPDNSSGHLAVVRFSDPGTRNLVQDHLLRHGVETSVHYPIHPKIAETCPKAAELSKRILSIPCHIGMTPYDVRRVSRLVVSA